MVITPLMRLANRRDGFGWLTVNRRPCRPPRGKFAGASAQYSIFWYRVGSRFTSSAGGETQSGFLAVAIATISFTRCFPAVTIRVTTKP